MAAPPSEVLKEILALFSWNPPLLLPDPKKKPSTTTRLPGFYDKHFSKNLVLKRLKPLPSLVPSLAKNVQDALRVALPNLPPLGPAFITVEKRQEERKLYKSVVKDGKAVANLYEKYANYCLPVASTLALHPTASFSKWARLLCWTQSISSSGYAIMDGELNFEQDLGFDEDIIALRGDILGSMDDEVRCIFKKMRDSQFSLATWEIKNLGAGRSEVMCSIPNLGTFSWTFCTTSNCREVARHQLALKRVAEVVVGPDAKQAPWISPPTSEGTAVVIGPDALRPPWSLSTSEAGPSIHAPPSLGLRSWSLRLGSSLTSLSSDNNDEGTKKRATKRKRGKGSPSKDNHNAKKKRTDDDDNFESGDGEYVDDGQEQDTYQDKHDVTARNLVQQAWAQATRVDGTVIVLHSGNHELVCIRHRASQTLYMSDVIQPHSCVNPAYGELQVAIYVAAIQDAMDRMKQQQSLASPVSDDDGAKLIVGIKGQNNDRGSGSGHKGGAGPRGKPKGGHGMAKGASRFQGSAAEKSPSTDDELSIENLIHEASNREVVCLYLRYGVYDSPVPASFLRSAPSIMARSGCSTPPLSPICCYRPEDCLTIVLTSEIGRGATGVVHRGTLMPGFGYNAIPLDIVVKLAFDTEQRKALRIEYDVYRCLRLKQVNQGVTTALGFFDDCEDGACALVMLYAGVPFSTDLQGSLSISDCKAALSVLESIHCAGRLHGDIREDNILISDSGITIIDFGHSRKSNNKQAKAQELTQLRDLLGLAGDTHD